MSDKNNPRTIFGWCMYDWANSAFATTVLAALLPAYFAGDLPASGLRDYVRKPIFAREGANISIYRDGRRVHASDGPYGEEGYVYQGYAPLPKFGDSYALIGSWLVDGQPAGLSVREDRGLITQDSARYLPHIISA